MRVQNYRIDVPQAKIEQLQQKLALTDFPDELDAAGWDLGAPLNDVKRLVNYWQNDFDWRQVEAQLNQLPQFQANPWVAGFGEIEMHFIHQKSPVKNAIPLLFVHGWPGSFIEVIKLLPLLQGDGDSPAFHIVAPSLPNFGFSGGVKRRGFAIKQCAEAMHSLMQGLGYTKYVTQGGDLGLFITRALARFYPEHCLATHINMVRASPPSFFEFPLLAAQHAVTPYTTAEKEGLERSKWFLTEGSGYRAEHSTKPQTLGYSLTDSPVALLSWVYEKLHDWTDGYPWTDNEILTWISIYWFSTAGPGASIRIYYEAAHEEPNLRDASATWIGNVKLATAHFPKELGTYPRLWSHTLGPIVYASENDSGGHFAAWERPEVIATDLQKMFKRGGPCYQLVAGASGYP